MNRRADSCRPSEVVAKILAGAWRFTPSFPQISEAELDSVVEPLVRSGAGALAWRQLSSSTVGKTRSGSELEEVSRLHKINAAVHEHGIQQVFSHFRSKGIEPILVKGWGIARLYPETALRPYGDIDLIIHPSTYEAAALGLKQLTGTDCGVDLHSGPGKLDWLSTEELFAGSQTVTLGQTQIRVPCPEDHLRILCLHLLHHGAWRPLWMCDIGAAIEARPDGFDWDRCLGGDKRRADWVACTIGLAHQLVGARVDDIPVASRARRLPGWLLPAVLRKWDTCSPPYQRGLLVPSLVERIRQPSKVIESVRMRWDNPIQATVKFGLPFNNIPRLPLQFARAVLRLPHAVGQAIRLLGQP